MTLIKRLRRSANLATRALPAAVARSIRFRYSCGFWPSLRDPQTLNEKINWRVVRDGREALQWTCDKLESKRRAALLAPDVLIPRTLWSGEKLEQSALDGVSGRWLLKNNAGSGNVIIGDGTPNVESLARQMSSWDVGRQAKILRERAYAHAQPGVLVEEWVGRGDALPIDYKVFVFGGAARFITAHSDRFDDHRASIYTPDWKRIDARLPHAPEHPSDLPRPEHLDALVSIAERIAIDFEFLRVDLFDTAEGVWFGETTPYPWSGLGPLLPASFEREAGSFWTLPVLSRADTRWW